jgi:PAN domain
MQTVSHAAARPRVIQAFFDIAFFALATILFLGRPAAAVDGTNLPGSDYASFPAHSAQVCQNTCGGESRCQAYTWVKPGIQGPSGMCWLKHSEPDIVKDQCCDSFTRRLITKADIRAEDKTDRPGLDYKHFSISGWQNCQASCAAEGICSSWTYVRPGIQGPTGMCWLKNRVARPVPNNGTVSGVKFVRPSQRID